MAAWRSGLVALTALAAGCSEITMTEAAPAVESVSPAAGAVDVSPAAEIAIRFTHPMMEGMEAYLVLHEGTVSGPPVAGQFVWSPDRRSLTFTPAAALKSGQQYILHLGGGLRDTRDQVLDHAHCTALGAETATGDMMGGSMMGPGWRHPDGTYGMVFSFTTAPD